jgi:hypothetical protein
MAYLMNFLSSPIQCNMELSEAVSFFATFANDVPKFREHVLSPTGLPLLINNTRHISTQVYSENALICNRLCWALVNISQFQWCIPVFIQHDDDACNTLVRLLLYDCLVS